MGGRLGAASRGPGRGLADPHPKRGHTSPEALPQFSESSCQALSQSGFRSHLKPPTHTRSSMTQGTRNGQSKEPSLWAPHGIACCLPWATLIASWALVSSWEEQRAEPQGSCRVPDSVTH